MKITYNHLSFLTIFTEFKKTLIVVRLKLPNRLNYNYNTTENIASKYCI